jgi:hypothetical protein
LHGAITLFDSLSLEAAVRAVWRPHAAFRQLLLERLQTNRIARRQSESLDRGEPRLALFSLRQVSLRQNFLQRLANRPPQTPLKLFDSCHPWLSSIT